MHRLLRNAAPEADHSCAVGSRQQSVAFAEIEKLDLDVLARICYVLECEPADIIKYND
jgi:DNA-binding Xre family transcriptional regulator